MALVMAFLAATNENRQLEDLLQADFGRVPERLLLSVRIQSKPRISFSENYAHCCCCFFCNVSTLFIMLNLSANTLCDFYSGLLILLFSSINKQDKIFLPLNFYCVYMINKIIDGYLQIRNFSSRVQLAISLVRCAHWCAIELITRRKIPHLRPPMYYSLCNKKQNFRASDEISLYFMQFPNLSDVGNVCILFKTRVIFYIILFILF